MDNFAVFLLSFGTPETLNRDDIRAFLLNIRNHRATPEALVDEVLERYRRIGGSPLNQRVAAIARALEQRLQTRARQSRVFVGNLYWKPTIAEVARQIHAAGFRRWVALPLAPQYSKVSVANYLRAARHAAEALEPRPQILAIERWGDHPEFIAAWAERVREALSRFPRGAEVTTVFTAHSIPAAVVERGDPYPDEVHATARRVAQAAGLTRWQVAYQSAGASAVPWLGPDVLEAFTDLARQGVRHALVVPIGFLTDHEEVLFDLDIELRQHADQLGVHMERAAMLNTHPRFIAALEDLVWQALAAQPAARSEDGSP